MKVKVVEAPVDDRIWCEQCRIRIAPNEERAVNRGKVYHQRCYTHLFPPSPSVPRKLSSKLRSSYRKS